MEAGAISTTRTTRFMMEGVGARVIRGPDWKWGKQVRFSSIVILCNFPRLKKAGSPIGIHENG